MNHSSKHRITSREAFRARRRWTSILTVMLLAVLIPLGTPMAPTVLAKADTITGTVYQDLNASGTRETGEPGVGGVTVSAYQTDGAACGSTVSLSSPLASIGSFSFAHTCASSEVRLEFTSLPNWAKPGPHGTGSGTSVQFVADNATGVLLGINNPANYSQTNPMLTTPWQVFGDQVTNADSFPNRNTLTSLSAAWGTDNADAGDLTGWQAGGSPIEVAQAQDTGTLYGVAWQRKSNTLFAGAYYKHFAGFGQNGSDDKSGAIYSVGLDSTTGMATTSPVLFADVNEFVDVTCPARDRVTGGDNDQFDFPPKYDDTTIDNIGKCSLGDLEISDDEATLFAMDLKGRQVLRINAATGAYIGAWPVPGIVTSSLPRTSGGTCPVNDVRPLGLGYHNGQLYVGAVCSAESTVSGTANGTPADIEAYVWTVDSGGSYSLVLNYQIIADRYDAMGSSASPAWGNWNPWKSNYAQLDANQHPGFASYKAMAHPQPMLSDIEFYGDDLVLGFRDRLGDQWGHQIPANNNRINGVAVGDVKCAAWNGTSFVLENNGSCGGRTASNAGEGDDPTNEFYWGDGTVTPGDQGDDATEYSMGGLAQWTTQPLAHTTVDPPVAFAVNYWDNNGINWLNNQNGAATKGYVMFEGSEVRDWGKASALGDLEALVDPAPIELGNRVWEDADRDGIQDPGESGIDGVTVSLYQGATLIATAVTADGGQYLFSSASGTDTGSVKYGLNILPDTNYEVRINTTQGALSGTPFLTKRDAPQPANGNAAATDNDAVTDVADSDADQVGDIAIIAFTAGGAGSNNHGLDIGFGESQELDWGDAPDPASGTTFGDYNTTSADSGPNHTIISGLSLGLTAPDADDGTLQNAAADADDTTNTGAADDEDGIPTLPTIETTSTSVNMDVSVTNSTGSNAELACWIDFDKNGVFDSATERASATVASGETSKTLTFSSFATPLTAGNTYIRCRIASNAAEVTNPTGAAASGEVEDHLTPIVTPMVALGSFVWEDANDNGAQDVGEPGIGGATVRLLDSSGNPVTADAAGNPLVPVVTGSEGFYHFQNLPESDYKVEVTVPADYVPTSIQVGGPINGSTSTNVSNSDSNIESSPSAGVYRSGVVTLTADSEPTGETQADGSTPDNPANANADDNNGNMTVDFGFVKPATIGNYVWVDENSDGAQDEGEPGIPGVVVQLTPPARIDLGNGAGGVVTTVTDGHGGYLFDNLPPLASGEQYVVTVPTSNWGSDKPLEGMYQTPLSTGAGINGDFGNKDDGSNDGSGSTAGYVIGTLNPGDENLTADFGYNYNPNDDVNTPAGSPTAALGDRVWIDSDGDGVQDPNEIGVSGVTLTLVTAGSDGIFDTADDVDADTATTDDNGTYLFDGLTPGGYVVVVTDNTGASHPVPTAVDGQTANGYTQTGDPDHFAVTDTSAGNNDGQSTDPIILGPGDVFLNVDFGYQPTSATLGSIGDTVFFDADADGNGPSLPPVTDSSGASGPAVTQGAGGTADATDYGIVGVTVSLIQDTNGNGVWDTGEPIIATDITDENGQYLFEGLPIDDGGGDSDADYLVWVNDTDNVLDGLTPTYDNDGLAPSTGDETGLGISAVAIDSTTPNVRNQDFGYSASSPVGSIGDTVWHDVDNSQSATQDPSEPGLSGVTVKLYSDATPANPASGDEVLAATTTTDGNGNYLFSNLPLGGYTVEVDSTTLPSGSTWTQTYDQDAPLDHRSSTTLTEAVPHDRDQDFSYTQTSPVLYSVGDTVWFDVNTSGGDQTTQGAEPGIAGVIVVLLDNSGAIVATTTTDGNGSYLFTDLPGAVYEVVVDTSTLPGYVSPTSTHERDTPSSDSRVTLTLGPSDEQHPRDVDFSYPQAATPTSGTIGDTVWFDVNDSGTPTPDAGEPGLPTVTVTLYSDDDDNGTPDTLVGITTTDANGNYLFTDLPLSDGSPDTKPDYVLVVDSGTLPSYVDTVPSYDPYGSDDNQSLVELSAASPVNLDQDFSYPPATALGAIGDTVWFDSDTSGGDQTSQGDEPGIEGVLMELFKIHPVFGSIVVIDSTVTGNIGDYYFGNLPLNETYYVRVAGANLVSGVLEGMSPTYDPDASTDVGTGAAVTLTSAVPVNLDQDFSYTGSGSIGNRIWLDQNADGDWDGVNGPDNSASTDDDEPGIEGVTVDLYRDLNGNGVVDAGEPKLGMDKTDASGIYLFDNLPIVGSGPTSGAAYVVDVTDVDGILNGYWHSLGSQAAYAGNPTADEQDQSKADPFAVEIGGSRSVDNLNVDFGYYVEPAAVGNYVWTDINGDGIQQDAEPAIEGVEIQMVITYPDNTQITLTTVTDANGYYSFPNLLLDEDYATGSSTNAPVTSPPAQPTFKVSVDPDQDALLTLLETIVNNDTNPAVVTDVRNDSNEHSGTVAQPVQGLTDTSAVNPVTDEPAIASYDFGYEAALALGGTIWNDSSNDNSTFDSATEPVLSGITVKLYKANPDGSAGDYVDMTTTDGNGVYSFGQLPAGDYIVVVENYATQTGLQSNAAGSPDPDTVGGDTDTGKPNGVNVQTLPVTLEAYTGSAAEGSEPTSERENLLLTGLSDPQDKRFNYQLDLGFTETPLAVNLSQIRTEQDGETIHFVWETATETSNAGFNLYMVVNGELVRVNEALIPSSVIDSVTLVNYTYETQVSGERYYIELVSISGNSDMHGPFDVGTAYGAPAKSSDTIFLPIIMGR